MEGLASASSSGISAGRSPGRADGLPGAGGKPCSMWQPALAPGSLRSDSLRLHGRKDYFNWLNGTGSHPSTQFDTAAVLPFIYG